MLFGTNFLPNVGWTLVNASMTTSSVEAENRIVIGANGSASITITSIENTNLLPDELLLLLTAISYADKYSPLSLARLYILYEDGNTYDTVMPIIDIANGFSTILYPSISNYEGINVGAFSSLTFSIFSSEGITLTAWSLAKSLNNQLVTDTLYYGIRISTETGFEAIRSDNRARAYFNADTLAMQSGDGTGTNWVNKLYYEYDAVTGATNLVFDGTLSADVINALSALITPNLYAGKATIAEITVDQLETGDKVGNYLQSNTADVNFQKIYDQYHKYITATVTNLANPTHHQVTNRGGQLLFWTDETFTAAIAEETPYPVYIYDYTELTKLEITFEYDGTYYIPKLTFGTGTGVGDQGKAKMYKTDAGFYLDYYSGTTLDKYTFSITDAGIDFSGFPSITFDAITAIIGICQIWVQDDTPVGAKTNDVWVDTDDYTRYDKTSLGVSTMLAVSDNEIITASGTFTITLHSAAIPGIIKKIYNVGTGIVLIAGTINGLVNMYLYPNESIELITDGSGWRY